jgi:alpha-ketoglutaric semialdehyde dehydrogenase
MTGAVELRQLIAGQWRAGSGDPVTSVNPARPSVVVAEGSSATVADVDSAVAAAQEARTGWVRAPIHQRGAVLLEAAAVVERNALPWGLELATEEGKTKAEGIGEVRRAAQILRYYGNEGDRQAGEIFASPRSGEQILVTRKPIGVVAIVTPFNFPIAIPAWKVAPALVYGNTVVWKPATTVPLLAIRLADALTEAGLPAGVLNLVIGKSSIGEALVNHPGVDAISFTGSTSVGRRIAGAAAARGVPVQAEMGGKNAAVVLDDADIGLALDQVMLGAFRSTGQKCTATSRLIVTDQIADRFLAELSARTDVLVVGDPTDEATQMGPVITGSAQRGIYAGIGSAITQGGEVLTGGGAYRKGPLAEGFFVAPTIVELTAPADIWSEELFGPVLVARRAADADEAFALANDSQFGLSAAVFT